MKRTYEQWLPNVVVAEAYAMPGIGALEFKKMPSGGTPVRSRPRTENETGNPAAAARKSVGAECKSGIWRIGALISALALACGCMGCASTDASLADISAKPGRNFRKIALVPLVNPTAVSLQKPFTKQEAAMLQHGEEGSPGFGPPSHGGAGGGEGALLMLAALPVALVLAELLGPGVEQLETAGAKAYGHLLGESEAKLAAALPAMTNALAELRFEETLRSRLAQSIELEAASPVEISQPRPDIHPAPADQLRTFYSDLITQGVDAVIEINIRTAALSGRKTPNPPLALSIQLQLRIVDLRDGKELDLFEVRYRGRKQRFVQWARSNAKPFREEVERCYQMLTKQVVTRIASLSVARTFRF